MPSSSRLLTTGGKQLLNHVVDNRASYTPEDVYAEYPISPTGYEKGFRKITYADLANTVNGVAWWLHETIGPGHKFETLAYIGNLDIRYNALPLGAVKAGYKVLLSSPRNSIPAHVNLFELLNCQVLITPTPRPQAVTTITAAHDIRVLEIPTVDELLNTKWPHYPFHKTFEDARNEPLLVLHTSGTTGFPKPILWTHDFAASWLQQITMKAPRGYENAHELWYRGRLFFLFPPFHAASMFGSLLGAILLKTTAIFPPAATIPSAQILADGLKHTTATCAAIVPLVADELVKNPELLDIVSTHLDSLCYSGGNVGQAIGDKISEKMKFFTIIGSTETGLLPTMYPSGPWSAEHWNCLCYNPLGKIDIQQISENEHEPVLLRHPDPELEQPVFKVFSELTEYRIGDIYVPHQTPDCWLYRGRSDDIIVFLTGEKTNPISMEEAVVKHPEVRSVLVIGAQRFQAALLVEPLTTEPLSTSERAEFIERLWPTIQEANLQCPRHAQIKKSHIMFTIPEKPMQRAGKGTIQRRHTLALYTREIDALYEDADKVAVTNEAGPAVSIDLRDSKALSKYIGELLVQIVDLKDFNDKDNFFIAGMDSLQAVQLTRSLKAALALPDLEISTVYANPSISTITQAILKLSEEHGMSTAQAKVLRSQTIDDIFVRYKAQVDEIAGSQETRIPRREDVSKTQGRFILLTGSTGAIGSYILQLLLEDNGVSHIYCLNRSSDPYSLQVQRNKSRNLATEFPTSRVTFLTAELSKDFLGLELPDYEKLRTNVTDIIHNAWPVNFNLSVATFEPHLSGTINLLKLAASATYPFTFLFVSSVSSVLGSSMTPIPEQIISDSLAPLPMGYGESKFITERLLDHAGTVLSDSNILIARVGQVAGPAHLPGHWNKQEWFPSLVTSSLHLSMLPDSLGPGNDDIEWVPIDFLAGTLIDLLCSSHGDTTHGDKNNGAKVFHPLNPHPIRWSTLQPIVLDALNKVSAAHGRAEGVQIVSLATWIERLRVEARALDGEVRLQDALQVNPAVKLVEFFKSLLVGEGAPRLEGERAREASKVLRGLQGLERRWLERWIADWVSF